VGYITFFAVFNVLLTAYHTFAEGSRLCCYLCVSVCLQNYVWYVCMLHHGSNCSLARAMDSHIMRCGIISSCQSAATSEIVKRSWACVHRVAALYQVPDLYLYLLRLLKKMWNYLEGRVGHGPGNNRLDFVGDMWSGSPYNTIVISIDSQE